MAVKSCAKLLASLALYLFLKGGNILVLSRFTYEISSISNIIINKGKKFETNLVIKSENEVDDYFVKLRTSRNSSFVPTRYKSMHPFSNTQVLLNQIRFNLNSRGVHRSSEGMNESLYHKDDENYDLAGDNVINFGVDPDSANGISYGGCSTKMKYNSSAYLEANARNCTNKTAHDNSLKSSLRNSTNLSIKPISQEKVVCKAVIVVWENNFGIENDEDDIPHTDTMSDFHFDEMKQNENFNIQLQAHYRLIKIFEEEMKYSIDNHRHLRYLGISILEFVHEIDEAEIKSFINKAAPTKGQIRYIAVENLSTSEAEPSDVFFQEEDAEKKNEAHEHNNKSVLRYYSGSDKDDVSYFPFTVPNEWNHLNSSTQWPLWITRMPFAWKRFGTGSELKGKERPIIMIADSGVDIDHKDLKENIYVNEIELNGVEGVDDDNNTFVDDIHGINLIPKDFFEGDCGSKKKYDNMNLCDFTGHGTQVAGVAGAVGNNSLGIVSPNWNPLILTCKMTYRFTETFVCVDYAIQARSRISVHSYYHSDTTPLINSVWGIALQRAAAYNHTILFSAGNKRLNHDNYHSHLAFSMKHKNLITVAASTAAGTLAQFSDYGRRTVNIAAPGTYILTTQNGGGYSYVEGTSFAAPLVASIASLMISYNPSLSYAELRDILVKTSIKKPNSRLNNVESDGFINGEAAIESAIIGGCWMNVNANMNEMVLKSNKELRIPLTFNGYDRGVYKSDIIVEVINLRTGEVRDSSQISFKISCETVPYLDRLSLETVEITRSLKHDNPKTVPLHNAGGGILYVQVLNSTVNGITLEPSQDASFDRENDFHFGNPSRWILVPEHNLTFLKARCHNNAVGRYTAVFSILAIEGPEDKENIYNLKVICTIVSLKISEIIFRVDFDKMNALGYS